MTTDHSAVCVGGYKDLGAAAKEFDVLAQAVADKKVSIEAAILITHAEDGTVSRTG